MFLFRIFLFNVIMGLICSDADINDLASFEKKREHTRFPVTHHAHPGLSSASFYFYV